MIPGGGSNALGALGYVACAEELLQQSFDMGLTIDHIVCASGSGGTHAGLLAGMVGMNTGIPVTGISVRFSRLEQEERIAKLANEVLDLLAVERHVDTAAVTVFDDYVGPGYSLPAEGTLEAIRDVARIEGILLDPVYTGKTMEGLIDLVRRGRFEKGQNVLFIHTGGAPSLFACQRELMGEADRSTIAWSAR